MENEKNQNQGSNSGQSQKKKSNSADGTLKLLQPHDMSKTFESVMHVVQGRRDKLPELLHDVGTLVLQTARKMSTRQLILTAGAVTIGAILAAQYIGDVDFDFDDEDEA